MTSAVPTPEQISAADATREILKQVFGERYEQSATASKRLAAKYPEYSGDGPVRAGNPQGWGGGNPLATVYTEPIGCDEPGDPLEMPGPFDECDPDAEKWWSELPALFRAKGLFIESFNTCVHHVWEA